MTSTTVDVLSALLGVLWCFAALGFLLFAGVLTSRVIEWNDRRIERARRYRARRTS